MKDASKVTGDGDLKILKVYYRLYDSGKDHRLVVAAYEQAWQEKVERIGNLNYPDEARRDKLSGTLTLDHRVLTVSNVVATLAQGRIAGKLRVDHRAGRPRLSIDLRLAGLTLDSMIGNPDMVSGRVRGHVALTGEGDTVREALSRANGKAAIVATEIGRAHV